MVYPCHGVTNKLVELKLLTRILNPTWMHTVGNMQNMGGIPSLMEKSYLRSSLNFVKILACEPFLES